MKIIEAETGEVKSCKGDYILKSNAIGSCVAVAAYSKTEKKIGAIAHIMLPGKSPDKDNEDKTRYAYDAINELIKQMTLLGANQKDIEVCLVGAGNVLKRNDDTICQDNINSVIEHLNKKNIKIMAKSLGGTKRRTVTFDVHNGNIFYTIGDGNNELLWKIIRV